MYEGVIHTEMFAGFERVQMLQDTSHYVQNEMAVLDREQSQIDECAAKLEKQLREIMDTGKINCLY